MQEVHHEVEQADQETEEHGGVQAASELGDDAARDQGDRALPRGDANRHGRVLEQRSPEAHTTRLMGEEPRMNERNRDSGYHCA